ncbi:HD domain-containing protein [Enorma phocaeensis]|uniref:HDIG domain-containing protein n=1 Tax=Enorma phocaeensis TaxID=1871019 RepID=A0A921IT68_9ACTN|nr:HDIG domain-containing protein [Enorma phocaeensis]
MASAASSIDHLRAQAAFDAYVAPYDTANPRIALKVEHTLRVAELSERIAREAGFTPAGIDLAWLCGLLHDIGRFEQLRRWDTFSDAASTNHAALGVEVLFGADGNACADSNADAGDGANADARDDAGASANDDASTSIGDGSSAGVIHRFIDPNDELESIVYAAVAYHSDFRLPDHLDVRTRAICDVVRDADKIDILRVTCSDSVETVLGVSEDELLASTVSPAVEDAFFEHRTVRRDERATPADFLVSLACFSYELAYPASLGIAEEQGFMFLPFERPFGIGNTFTDPATRMLMSRMDGHLRAWVEEQDR